MRLSTRGGSAILALLLGSAVPLARTYTRPPPSDELVVMWAREGFTRRAGAGGTEADLERLSAAVAAAPEAAVRVHSRCVEFTFSFLSAGRWFYDVEVAPDGATADRYWLEVVDLAGGPALFGVDATSPVPGCVDR